MRSSRIVRLPESPGSAVSPSPARPAWTLYALGVALIAILVVGLASFAAWQDRQHYRYRTTVATQNIARLLDETFSKDFDKADVVLRSVVEHYGGQAGSGAVDAVALSAYLARHEALVPELLSLRATDKDGVFRYGRAVLAENQISLADRDFFARLRDDPAAGLVVAGPLLARISQQWVIVLARRLNAADGSFAGVVCANFSVAHLEQILSSLALGRAGAATLRTADLALVARAPSAAGAVGSTAVSKGLRDAMATHAELGQYVATTQLDGVERSNAYRKLKHYPFYVLVGFATEGHPAGWTGNLLTFYALAALAILVAGLAALQIFRNTRKMVAEVEARKATEAALLGALHEAEDLYNNAPNGYHSLGPDGIFLRINDTELNWLGYARSEIVGVKTARELLTPASQARFDVNFPMLIETGELRDARLDLLRKDGTILTVEVSATTIRDENGVFQMSRTMLTDLSARLAIETQLQEAQRIAKLGSWQVNLISNEIAWSDEMFEIYDIPECLGKPVRESFPATVHPDDRQQIEGDFAMALERRACFDTTLRVLPRAGGLKYVHVLGSVQSAADGTPLCIRGTAQDFSDSIRQQLALMASEARFRSVVEDQTELIGRFLADGTMVFANEVCARFFGKEVNEIVGRKWQPAVHADDLPLIEAQLRSINPQHSAAIVESRVYSGDGELRWMQFTNRGIFDAHGRLSEIQSVGRDITERVRDAERLDHLLREQDAILDNHFVGFAKVRDRQHVWCNASYARMLGYTREELTGLPTRIIHVSDQASDAFAKAAYPAMQRGEIFQTEMQCPRQDGTIGWYALSGVLMEPGSDESIWTFVDITEKKEIEVAFAFSNTRLRSVFSTMAEGLVFHGADGVVTDANQAAADILELSRHELIGARTLDPRWQQIREDGTPFPDDEHPAMETLRNGQPLHDQILGIHLPAKGLRWISMNSTPIFDDAACSPVAVVVTFSDITERMANIACLRRAYERLEALNAEQAAHLRALAGDLTHAEQRERDRLYALLHDGVQPILVAARLSLSSLNAQTTPERCARVAADACGHIGQVLLVARNLSIELSPPLIRERGLIPALESLCRWVKHNHALDIDLTALAEAEPDDLAIRLNCFNVARELVLNVAKHAGARHSSIDLRLADRDTLRITVSDDGVGFDPLAPSSGTGLSGIEQRLMMFGGVLEITSEPGRTLVAAIVPRRLLGTALSSSDECGRPRKKNVEDTDCR